MHEIKILEGTDQPGWDSVPFRLSLQYVLFWAVLCWSYVPSYTSAPLPNSTVFHRFSLIRLPSFLAFFFFSWLHFWKVSYPVLTYPSRKSGPRKKKKHSLKIPT